MRNSDRLDIGKGVSGPQQCLRSHELSGFTEGMAAMKHEAKFSVILPAGSFKSSQTEAFEQAVQHYSIPAKLPLYTDSKGNYVVSSGLCLRDAQLLRRQVSGCGFPADVISDSAEAASAAAAKATELKELKSELSNVNVDSLKIDSDLPSDAWGSMELPSSLDLGLNDGEDLEKKADWSGENWLSPDMSEHTLSVSAEVLMQKARESAVDLPPVTGDELKNAQKGKTSLSNPESKGLPKLGSLKPAAGLSKSAGEKSETATTADATKATSGDKASATDNKEDAKLAGSADKASSEEKADSAPEPNVADAEKAAQEAQKKADAQSTRTASFSPPPEILQQAAAEQAQKKEESSEPKPADDKPEEKKTEAPVESAVDTQVKSSNSKALAKSAGPEMTIPEPATRKAPPTDTIMMVALAVVVICLILALVSAFVSPITALVSPLF